MYIAAADTLRKADGLIRDAAGVGVALETPNGYADRHAVVFARAVDQAIAQATSAGQRADYARCVELVERAQQQWEPRTDQQYQLNRLLHDVLVA